MLLLFTEKKKPFPGTAVKNWQLMVNGMIDVGCSTYYDNFCNQELSTDKVK